MKYIIWALIGMVGYSFTTLFVKLATRSGKFSSFLVLAIASVIVCMTALSITLMRGDIKGLSFQDFTDANAIWAYASGIALSVAVASLFRALSLGPASIVVPIYGLFIVGGAILGSIFLHEPLTIKKLAGIGFAVLSIYFIAGSSIR